MKLDPVAENRRSGDPFQCPARARHRLESHRSVDRPRVDGGARPGQQRRLHAGGRRQPNLDRLAVGAERPARPPGAERPEREGMLPLLRCQPQQPRRGHRRTDRGADGGRVPPRLVQRRVTCRCERGHGFEPLRVGVQRLAEREPELRGHHQRRRRARRTDVSDAVGERVVVVEHVAGRGHERDLGGEIVAGRAHRPRCPLRRPRARAGEPVGEREPVCGLAFDVLRSVRAGYHPAKATPPRAGLPLAAERVLRRPTDVIRAAARQH